jgi:hypothetical protein
MAHGAKDQPLDKLKGSEQHHPLKNRPGEKGDPDHADDGGTLSGKAADAAKAGKTDTQLGAELKDAARSKD